jgi:hypothetical protein
MEVRLAIFNKRMARVACAAAAIAAGVIAPGGAVAESLSDRVDNLSNSLDEIESKVQSTLLSGGSSPISFSGEARLKMQYHNLGFDAPAYMQADRSYFQSGWEGNENLFRLGMIVSPSRNTVLWSKIGLQHTLTGNYYDDTRRPDGVVYPYRHDKARSSVTIHEDMAAGIAVRTVPASFWVKLGNTMWTEASPLTVWKAQPRTFAWEYLPFEVEQPIARYYEYNIARGEKSGRAAWNKKPFNGINVESISLPLDLYANVIYGTFERYDNFEREYIDFASDLGYGNLIGITFPEKGHGIGDSYRHVLHARLAESKWFGDMIMGLNYVGIDYSDDILYAYKGGDSPLYFLINGFRSNDSLFVKEPKTLSVDIKGPIGDKFSIHADVAFNMVDTVWYVDTVNRETRGGVERYYLRTNNPDFYNVKSISSSDLVFAGYTKLGYNGVLPIEADLAYIGKGFYSPFSFVTPIDAFYAYGSNMVGAGKFIARGEGSPYTQNMAGVNFTVSPKLPGYGHLRLKYGQHFNVEEGRDLLFFPYRLNGSDMFTFFHSSFNRWGNSLVDNSVKAGGKTYRGRLGDESFVDLTSWNANVNNEFVAGPGAGGLRSDYLAMFEGFVPYENAQQAFYNFRSKTMSNEFSGIDGDHTNPKTNTNLSTITNQSLYYYDTIRNTTTGNLDSVKHSTNSSWVPESKKYTFNFELDAAYDIGPLVGYRKDLFIGGYAGVNGVSSSVKWLEFSDEANDMLLWSFYFRFEPAIALHKSFYLLGLFGFENWRSKKSWMMVSKDGDKVTGVLNPTDLDPNPVNGNGAYITVNNFERVPINNIDYAYGIGFDWDMLERVGLHGRVKWISHEDRGLNDKYKEWGLNVTDAERNDWLTPVFTLEVKTWF